jgi:hypothetical protein
MKIKSKKFCIFVVKMKKEYSRYAEQVTFQ